MKPIVSDIIRITIVQLTSAIIMAAVFLFAMQFPRLINIKADVTVTQVIPKDQPQTSSTYTVKGDIYANEK